MLRDPWVAAALQFGIVVPGLLALCMAFARDARARRWAPLVGLVGQPCWVVVAANAQAWGVLVLTLAYTAVYLVVAWREWVLRPCEG